MDRQNVEPAGDSSCPRCLERGTRIQDGRCADCGAAPLLADCGGCGTVAPTATWAPVPFTRRSAAVAWFWPGAVGDQELARRHAAVAAMGDVKLCAACGRQALARTRSVRWRDAVLAAAALLLLVPISNPHLTIAASLACLLCFGFAWRAGVVAKHPGRHTAAVAETLGRFVRGPGRHAAPIR